MIYRRLLFIVTVGISVVSCLLSLLGILLSLGMNAIMMVCDNVGGFALVVLVWCLSRKRSAFIPLYIALLTAVVGLSLYCHFGLVWNTSARFCFDQLFLCLVGFASILGLYLSIRKQGDDVSLKDAIGFSG